MDDSGPGLAQKVAELAESLRSVEARLAALEGAAAPPRARPVSALPAAPLSAAVVATGMSAPSYAALLGRALFVLAGAFLVRALTDSGALPRGAGVALGLAYAATWLFVADRAGRPASPSGATAATAYGITALVIACPLVWEAATRFEVLPAAGAAAALFTVAVAALAVSVGRRLQVLGWATALSTLATALALIVATHSLVIWCAYLVALALLAWAASDRAGWPGVPWATALAADLVVLEMIWIVSRPEGLPEAHASLSRGAVLALALALFAAPLAGWATRSFGRPLGHRPAPDAFEIAQSGAALLLVVFAFSKLLPVAGIPPSLFWVVAGLAMAALPARVVGPNAPVYGAILLLGAALASGLVAFAGHAFLGPPAPDSPTWDAVLVVTAAAVSTALLVRGVRSDSGGRVARGVMLALACAVIAGVAAFAERALAALVAPDGDPARIACVRSAVLAALSVLLASCGRLPSFSDLARLGYPVLVFAALKLVFEDFPHGRPATLVATFVLYGAALIAVPKILRHGGDREDGRKIS